MMKTQALALMAAAAIGSACTDGGTSLVILQNQVPGAGCSIGTDTSTFNPIGRIDTDARDGYLFTPVVQSLVAETASETGSPRIVFIEGADVKLSFQAGLLSEAEEAGLEESGLSEFSLPFSGAVMPGGLASFAFVVVPKKLLDTLAGKVSAEPAHITAEVTMFGELDGGSVESQSFNYPIQVCSGCMRIDNGPCADLPDSFEPLTGGACQQLQDVPVDCCTDTEGALVCPAVKTDPV